MAQNIRVCCRYRPPSGREIESESERVIEVNEDHKLTILSLPKQTKFVFDYVFDTDATQAEVFQHTAQPLVQEIMYGFNCTVFAYGQTGSGKTFTMMGEPTPTLKGIIPRLVENIFEAIMEADDNIEFTIKLSYLEIYNERIRDLLDPSKDNLKIREVPGRGVYCEELTESYVSSFEEVLEVMAAGQTNRAIASTKMNVESSRSHSVFILTLGQSNKQNGSRKGSKLTLVDLAGSEKVMKTGAVGQTLKEAQHINKSLSALGNVINALTSKSKHIPYRDSKLTRLLTDSLGGNSKTVLVVTGSPMSTNAEETLSTLRFGTRAKSIKNKPKVNQEKSVAEYKRLLKAALQKCKIQEGIIKALEEDVEALLACLSAVAPQHLVIPIPVLKSTTIKASARAAAVPVEGDEEDLGLDEEVPPPAEHEGAEEPHDAPEGESEEKIPEEIEEEKDSKDRKDVRDSKEAKVVRSQPGSPAPSARALVESSPSQPARELVESGGLSKVEELRAEIMQLKQEKADLWEQLQDKTREMEQQSLVLKNRRSDLEQKLSEVEDAKSESDAKASLLEEKTGELDRLSKKMALMEKEHSHAVDQVAAERDELKIQLQKALENLEQYRKGGVDPSLEAAKLGPISSISSPGGQDAELKKMRSNYETLMRALKKKCDAYMHLQIIHQESKDHMARLEKDLKAANKKLENRNQDRKIRDLENRLAKSQEICEKLFQSGMYWRQRRFGKEGGQSKIRVPIKGGGGAKRKLDTGINQGSSGDVASSSAASASSSLSLIASPSPAFTSDAMLSPKLPSSSLSSLSQSQQPSPDQNSAPKKSDPKLRKPSRAEASGRPKGADGPSDSMDHFF